MLLITKFDMLCSAPEQESQIGLSLDNLKALLLSLKHINKFQNLVHIERWSQNLIYGMLHTSLHPWKFSPAILQSRALQLQYIFRNYLCTPTIQDQMFTNVTFLYLYIFIFLYFPYRHKTHT